MNPRGSQRIHWRRSLATRLAAAWAVSLGAAVAISSWGTHRDSGKRLIDDLRREIKQDAGEIHVRLETWSQAFQEDARSCSQSPLVDEFLKQRNTDEEGQWRALLEDQFRSVFAGKPAYFQMRLLAADGPDEGRELVRLDRTNAGELTVTPKDRLQSKASRSYFKDAIAMAPGEIYLSEIDLNRDFGEITFPYIPTIRAAVKIASATPDTGAAILIINADMRPIFNEVRRLASPTATIRLFDSPDNYLLHPQPDTCYASDLGTGLRPIEEYPEIKDHANLVKEDRWLRDGETADELALASRVELTNSPMRAITLMISIPEKVWLPELKRSKQRTIWATALAALAGVGVAVLVSLPFTRRLRSLTSALRHFDASENPKPIPESGQDEIGLAIERFGEMTIKVREQIEDLKASRHQAEEANAAKETFLAVMSHEIRTPMNAIVGLIRALETNHPPGHQQPILASLRSSSSHLMTLLNTALDFTRLREGVIEYQRESFDAALLVTEICQAFKPSAMAKHLDLAVKVPETLVVLGDAVRFRQMVNNLVSNAIKFTPSGFVKIALHHENDELICVVTDSGPGIREQDHDRVFQPFASLKSGDLDIEPGAGLGLAVSKQLAEQQHGQLIVVSQPGEGATFTLRLPHPLAPETEPEKSEPASKTASGPTIRRGLRLLYVEDVASNQLVMELTLEATGSELVCVSNGAEAIAATTRESFDVVLLDLQLPDMTGYDLATKLLATHPRIPLIAVTAQSSKKTEQQCRELGILEIVLKPYSAEALLNAIERVRHAEIAMELHLLHPQNPERSRTLAATMATELRLAAQELKRIESTSKWPSAVAELKRLRHKLKTAITLFRLNELDHTLDQLIHSAARNSEGFSQARFQLEDAAGWLEYSASNLSINQPIP